MHTSNYIASYKCYLYAEPSICRLLGSWGKQHIFRHIINSVPSYPIRHFVTWRRFVPQCALNASEV